MKAFLRILALQCFLAPAFSFAQTGEWLVEMNTNTGSFEAVGPMLEDVWTIFVGLQCKDETNGQYIFVQADQNRIMSVDISNAAVMANTPNPLGNQAQMLGFHCLNNCDTLVLICRDNMAAFTFLAHFDRFNGTEMIPVGDTIPTISAPGQIGTHMCETFDPTQNHVYIYSQYASLLQVIDAATGTMLEEYEVSSAPRAMAFDEINNVLYALRSAGGNYYRLLRFDTDLEDFVQVGDYFTMTASSYIQTTIDGNNQRMFVTRNHVDQGSFLTALDLITGEVLTDVQTMPGSPGGGPFGGPNTINGRYFNTTDQLITLHWGTGDNLHLNSTDEPDDDASKSRIYPNPHQGSFKIDLSTYPHDIYSLHISDLKGQRIYEHHHLSKEQSIKTDLAPGYYIATVLTPNGAVFTRIPFVVDSRK